MPASSTDVRAWAREQGHDVPARGAVPTHLRDLYDQSHPGDLVQGEIIGSSIDMGVTEADFPPADFDDPGPAPETASRPRTSRGERKPRAVKPPPAKGGFRERIFGGKTAAKPKHARGPRVSLSDWAEETWSDLAWLAQPIPPLAKILEIQAPYAGVVFDDQVKGTFVDTALQPVAQYSGVLRALNGLAGPPVYVGMICAVGQRVQVTGPDGKGVIDEDGHPVTDFDSRTKMLFQGLRYSLLQMTKISELNAEQIQARTQASVERMRTVDAIIASIFDLPIVVPAAPAPTPPAAGTPSSSPNGFRYPPPPHMDGTGADPGRM